MNLLINVIKRFWLIKYLGILVLSACALTSSQAQLFTSKEGNFSILMPGSISEEVNSPAEGITTRSWTTIKSESLYTVAHSSFTNKIAPEKIPKILQLLVQGASETNFIKVQKLSESSVNKNGYICQNFTFMGEPSYYLKEEFQKKGLITKSQLIYQRNILCMKNNYAVEAIIFTPSSEELKTNGEYFVKSLNLK